MALDADRRSRAVEVELITDPDEKARQEARNGLRQFDDGNGRTARAVSYVVLCVRLGSVLPGTNTIPEQIAKDKRPYYKALEAADQSNESGTLDLSNMETLLQSLLANQLVSVFDAA